MNPTSEVGAEYIRTLHAPLEPPQSVGSSLHIFYFVIAPTFETDAPAYAWLNSIVAVGKPISLNRSDDRHVTYDIFVVR
jgi:hypothetical protein